MKYNNEPCEKNARRKNMRLEEAKRILLNLKEPNERIIKKFKGRPEVLELKQIKRDRDAINTAIRSLDLLIQLEEETRNREELNKIFVEMRKQIEK